MTPEPFKVGDWIVRVGFYNFWPGQILEINPGGDFRKHYKIFWKDKNDWSWFRKGGFRKVSPLMLLAMCADE